LFTAETVKTSPCVHCGAPAIAIENETVHFEVADTGAKTVWDDCYTTVRGRRKPLGTGAAVAATTGGRHA